MRDHFKSPRFVIGSLFAALGCLSNRPCYSAIPSTPIATGDITGTIARVDALETADTNIKRAISEGGFAAKYLNTVTGDGASHEVALTMPDDMPALVAGEKYELTATFTAKSTGGSPVRIGARFIKNVILVWSGSAWSGYTPGLYDVEGKDASFATFFASDNAFPRLAITGANLGMIYTLEDAQEADLDGHVVINALGAESPA